MSTIIWALDADFDGDGAYETDLTQYIDMPGMDLRVSRGVGRDGKPRTTKFSLTLSNRDGTFTPENGNSALAGLVRPGVPVRLTATFEGTPYSICTAFAMTWKPVFRAGVPSTCAVECEDILWFLRNGKPVNVNASELRDTGDALGAVLDAAGLTAADRDFEPGVQALPLHFAVSQNPMDAANAVVASEMGGQMYPGADGRLRFEGRGTRLGLAVDDTWGAGTSIGPVAEDYELNPLEYYTQVTARATVFRTGQAGVEVFRFSRSMDTRPTPDSMQLAAGEVYERDFDTQSAIVALTDPVAGIDYLAHDAVDGSGTNRTALLAVLVTPFGPGRFRLRMENTHSGPIYVTRFRLRGQPVEFYADRALAAFELGVTGLKVGLPLEFDVPFGGDSTKLRDYAYQELRVGRYPWPVLRLTFRAFLDDEIRALMAVDIGHLIRYASGSDAFQGAMVDDWWYVEALDYTVPSGWAGEMFNCTVTLVKSFIYRNLDAIVYDVFDRDDAIGALGTSTSGAVWADDYGMDIVGGYARANDVAMMTPTLDLGPGITDVVVEVLLSEIGSTDRVGGVFGAVDDGNYYAFYIDMDRSEIVLDRVVDYAASELASVAYTAGTRAELQAMRQAGRIRLQVDWRPVIDVEDVPVFYGTRAGLYAVNADYTTKFSAFYAQGLNRAGDAAEGGSATMAIATGAADMRRRRRRLA